MEFFASNNSITAEARSPMVDAGALWMKTSPGRALTNANSTNDTASRSGIKNRVIDGSVTGKGRPCVMQRMKRGTTDPLEYMTFPYRTTEATVSLVGLARAHAWTSFSMRAFVIPIVLIG